MAKQTKTIETKVAPKADKPVKAAKAGKASKPTAIATSTPNPRAKRAGVVAIESAGGNAASVTIAKSPRMVIGGDDTSRAQQCLDMLRKSKTIGDYLAAREKAGLGETLGGYLPGWIEKGFVVVGKAGGKSVKSKTKVEA